MVVTRNKRMQAQTANFSVPEPYPGRFSASWSCPGQIKGFWHCHRETELLIVKMTVEMAGTTIVSENGFLLLKFRLSGHANWKHLLLVMPEQKICEDKRQWRTHPGPRHSSVASVAWDRLCLSYTWGSYATLSTKLHTKKWLCLNHYHREYNWDSSNSNMASTFKKVITCWQK